MTTATGTGSEQHALASPTRPSPAGGNARWRVRAGAALLLAPATIYFTLFFVVPLGILVLYSFYTYTNYSWTSQLTLSNYSQALTNPAFRDFYFRTLWVALLVSAIVVVLSYLFSYIISFVLPRFRRFLYFLVLVSLFGGYLVRIYAWRTMLGRFGIVNKTLLALGLVSHPVTSLLNSDTAIVIAMVNFLIPLGVLPIYAAMQNVSPHLFEAAVDLGASRLHTARTIVLPLSARGIKAAFAFCFIGTMAEWVTPQLLGGSLNQFFGNAIQYEFDTTVNWPLGAALALTLIASVVVVLALLSLPLRLVFR